MEQSSHAASLVTFAFCKYLPQLQRGLSRGKVSYTSTLTCPKKSCAGRRRARRILEGKDLEPSWVMTWDRSQEERLASQPQAPAPEHPRVPAQQVAAAPHPPSPLLPAQHGIPAGIRAIVVLHIIQSTSSIFRCLWEEVFTYSDFWPETWGGRFPARWHPAPTASAWRLLLLYFTNEIPLPHGSSGNGHVLGKAEDSLYLLWMFTSLLPHRARCPPATAPWGRHRRRGSTTAGQAGGQDGWDRAVGVIHSAWYSKVDLPML